MMPPFVPGSATPVEPRPNSFLAPPLRLAYALEAAPPIEEEVAASTAVGPHVEDLPDDGLPWLLRPGVSPEPGIDASETLTADAEPVAEPGVFTGNDEWETDQLAVFEEQEAPPEESFESDADLFARLFDELEGSGTPAEPTRAKSAASTTAAETDARQVEEVAVRLERIARSLRERGLAGPLAGESADPLGALVAGYLLGLAERSSTPDRPKT